MHGALEMCHRHPRSGEDLQPVLPQCGEQTALCQPLLACLGRQWKLRPGPGFNHQRPGLQGAELQWKQPCSVRSGPWLGENGPLTRAWDNWVYAPEYLEFEDSFKTPEPVTGSYPSLKSQHHCSRSLSTSTGSVVTLCQTRGPAVHQRDPLATAQRPLPRSCWRGGGLYRSSTRSEARLSEGGAGSSGCCTHLEEHRVHEPGNGSRMS